MYACVYGGPEWLIEGGGIKGEEVGLTWGVGGEETQP